jgi:hypothetical protein
VIDWIYERLSITVKFEHHSVFVRKAVEIGEFKSLLVGLYLTTRACFNYDRKGSFSAEVSTGNPLEYNILV